MKINVTQLKGHELFADRMEEGRWEGDYKIIQRHKWG
jgi:hypothetical protein